ncbi:MAG TPA: peptidyl-prolyl cis-trans isomerase [Spirochaetia bacterium]|nr:peptidyl-prolyl cis-trans isomerase [Spirochaetia bacterium]
MKRLSILVPALLLSAAGSLFAQVLDVPVARVELYTVDIVTQRELQQDLSLLAQQVHQDIPATQRKQYLEAKIGELLVVQAANHANVQVTQAELDNAIAQKKLQAEQLYNSALTDPQFQQIIQNQGITWPDYQSQIRKQLLEEKYIHQVQSSYFANLQEPTEAQIEQTYQDNATSFTNPAMVRFDYIATDIRNATDAQRAAALKKINSLYQDIRTGKSTFDQLLQNSVNDTSYTGGDFGYLMRNDPRTQNILGQSFIDSVFGLKLHEISQVIPSHVGYYICRITDKRMPKILTLDDPILPGSKITVRERITQYLMAQTQQKAFADAAKNLIDQLKQQANIKIYEENLNW